jgi:NitT/TauT family transport system permease protein
MAVQALDTRSSGLPRETRPGMLRRYPQFTAIGSALGALLGLVLSHWPILGKSWYPYIVGFQSLPKVALAPLMVVWFGFGLEGKVFITAIITFFPVLVNMMAGYQAVEPERIELARSCNASELHLFTKIIIPSCLPFLFAGLGVASVLSILGAVVGEFVGASAGLGMLLMQFNQAMEISQLFAVILLLGVIGFLMNYVVSLVERRYCFWAQRSNATARPYWDTTAEAIPCSFRSVAPRSRSL